MQNDYVTGWQTTFFCRGPSNGFTMKMIANNKLILAALVLISSVASAEDWVPLSSDEASTIFMSASPAAPAQASQVRLHIKLVYKRQRDLMGLAYNTTKNDYLISCASNEILSKQQFLFHDAELVWTFPESTKREMAGADIPQAALSKACAR